MRQKILIRMSWLQLLKQDLVMKRIRFIWNHLVIEMKKIHHNSFVYLGGFFKWI